MEFYKVPGVSLAVINDYQVEWAHAEGVLEAGRTDAVTPRALFQAGSLSKPVAALAALRLVEQGVLDLDVDIDTFLTSWKIPPNNAWQPRVTLRQLLTHTSGLTVPLYPGYPRNDALPSLLQVLEGKKPARTPAVRVDLIPGTQYRYSSGGYLVLQQLLMDVTGQSFDDLMRELILDPLGMQDSTFEQPLSEGRWHLAATGHHNGGQQVQGRWFVYPEAAQGGFWTTATDLAQVVVELQRASAGRSSRILSTRMATEMLSPRVDGHVGLGIFLEGDATYPRFNHIGGNEGFSSRLTGLRDTGRGAVVMMNWHYGFLVDEVFAAISKEYAWPGYLPEEPRRTTLEVDVLHRYVGTYQLQPSVDVRVTRVGEALCLEVTGQSPMEFYAVSARRFRSNVVDAEIAFRSAAGGPIELMVTQAGRQVVAKRLQ
jgi:CubicO group peptidase (beta-lactamase class C family)